MATFKDLAREQLGAEQVEKIEARARREAAKLPTPTLSLRELRETLNITQAQLSERAGMAQGDISKVERRGDVKLSTLRRLVQGLGGRLVLGVKIDGGLAWIDHGSGEAHVLADLGADPGPDTDVAPREPGLTGVAHESRNKKRGGKAARSGVLPQGKKPTVDKLAAGERGAPRYVAKVATKRTHAGVTKRAAAKRKANRTGKRR